MDPFRIPQRTVGVISSFPNHRIRCVGPFKRMGFVFFQNPAWSTSIIDSRKRAMLKEPVP